MERARPRRNAPIAMTVSTVMDHTAGVSDYFLTALIKFIEKVDGCLLFLRHKLGPLQLLKHILKKHNLDQNPLNKVSSNPKNWGINKWKFFINASKIHPQISLILLKVVSFYNLRNIFADKCLKMKLLIDICTVLCRIKKCTGLLILSSRSKHRSLCRVDLPLRQISYINFLKMKFFKLIAFWKWKWK